MKFGSFEIPPKKEKGEEGKSFLERFRNISKEAKITALATIFATSALESEAVTTEPSQKTPEKNLSHTETPQEEKSTYQATHEDFGDIYTLNISNAFETDSAKIKPENIEMLQNELNEFWKKLTPQNLEQFLSQPILIYSSCDQDRTSAYKGGNEELANLRAQEGERIVQQSLQVYDFSLAGFSEEDIEKIKNISIQYKIPEYEGYEKGVTPLTEIINPETGLAFTKEELDSMNPEQLEQLKQEARWVKIEVEGLRAIEHQEQQEKKSYDDRFRIILKLMEEYDDVSLVVDNSPSMNNSQELLQKTIAEAPEAKPVFYAPFSQRVGSIVDFRNTEAVKQSAQKLTKDTKELGLKAAIEVQKQLSENGSHAIIVITDESLQGISLEKLTEMESASSTDVYFLILNDDEQKYAVITLAEIKELFLQKTEKHRQRVLKSKGVSDSYVNYELNEREFNLTIGSDIVLD